MTKECETILPIDLCHSNFSIITLSYLYKIVIFLLSFPSIEKLLEEEGSIGGIVVKFQQSDTAVDDSSTSVRFFLF